MGLYRKVNGQLETISGANASGLPIGTIIEQENNNTIPTGYLLCDGSVFDETLYPALYMYLQSNVLPNKPILYSEPQDYSDYINAAAASYTSTGYIVPKYGWIFAEGIYPNSHIYVYVNGTEVMQSYSRYTSWEEYNAIMLPVKPGDVITATGTQNTTVRFYNSETGKYSLIKAVSGLTDSGDQAVYNQVKHYIDTGCPAYTYDSTTQTLNIDTRA